MTTRARRRVATNKSAGDEDVTLDSPNWKVGDRAFIRRTARDARVRAEGYRAGLLDAIKLLSRTRHAEGCVVLHARLAALDSGGKPCRACETQAAGLPTPGYTHDEACKRGKP